jgi:hypothetical protein
MKKSYQIDFRDARREGQHGTWSVKRKKASIDD